MSTGFAAILPVFNEEDRIVSTLTYYSSFFKVIYVIDNFSSDSTILRASSFPCVRILRKKNTGTPETTEWFDWLINTIDYDYYLFLSCSETLSLGYVRNIQNVIDQRIDLFYVNRISYTAGSPSMIFGDLPSIIGIKPYFDPTCRLARRLSLIGQQIKIHDNFATFKEQLQTVTYHSTDIFMVHERQLSSINKIVDYASCEAQAKNFDYPTLEVIKDLSRNIIVIGILVIRLKLSRVRMHELCMRMYLHLSVYMICAYSRLLPCSSLNPP